MPLSSDEGKSLLRLARKTIEGTFSDKQVDLKDYSSFTKKQGVFVTLTSQGRLRGCIGFPQPAYPLNRAICEAAKAAAFGDPRFPPMAKEELKEIRLELSVLSVPEEIKVKDPSLYPGNIKIGKDGLIIKNKYTTGLLLPQVFTEHKCTPKEALEWTCEKAGLPKDAWKDLSNKIFKFQAQIFHE